MKEVAACLIWQPCDQSDAMQAVRLSETVSRVYIVDRRERGETFGSLAEPRLHYAPFRQKATLGSAFNRALALAYEEDKRWLWLLDSGSQIAADSLASWSQNASAPMALYLAEPPALQPSLWRRPSWACLLSVTQARALGGWDPDLPAPLVFADFFARLQAAGGLWQEGLPIARQPSGIKGFDPWEIGRSLWIVMQRRWWQAPGAGKESR